MGLTGQMHGLVMLKLLNPPMPWKDQRKSAQCDEIRTWLGKLRLIQITGNDALVSFTMPKILWVRENKPAIFARTQPILLPTGAVDTPLMRSGLSYDRSSKFQT
jgi:xylulokinase